MRERTREISEKGVVYVERTKQRKRERFLERLLKENEGDKRLERVRENYTERQNERERTLEMMIGRGRDNKRERGSGNDVRERESTKESFVNAKVCYRDI